VSWNKYKTGMSYADLLLLLCTFPAPKSQMSMINKVKAAKRIKTAQRIESGRGTFDK
jgi:hypothetical protein